MTRARMVARAASVLVLVVGALALVGWIVDSEVLKGFGGGITMKANAATALLLVGASLGLLCVPHAPAWSRRAGQAFAILTSVIGAATLSQHLFGWNLGIDGLLSTEAPGALATTSPGRMGPPASICFTLGGIALVLLHSNRSAAVAQSVALIIGLIALLAVAGYAYSVETLYGVARYTGIALHTALSLLALSVGIIAVSFDRGFASVAAGVGAGSVMTRRLLGFAVLVPLLLGWLRIRLESAGYFSPRFGVTVFIVAIIVILAALIVRTALELNRVELQQLAAEATLRDRLHEMEAMMEVLPVGMLIATDQSGATIVGNRAARDFMRIRDRAHNLSLTAPAGNLRAHFRKPRSGEVVAPDDLPVQRAAREGVATQDLEMEVVFDDGDVRNVLITALPLLDLHGHTRGAVASVMDITARRAAEMEREDLLAREQEARAFAEDANRAKDEFLATISHELRTPLNAILGWSSMLREGTIRDPDMITNALGTIERSCKAQAQLIDDLLDVSRIRAGMLRLDLKPLDLTPIVVAAADIMRPAAAARAIELHIDFGPDTYPVLGDATRMQQVVWNLLANAVKFSCNGSVVTVQLAADSSDAVLTVTDAGEGIDPEFLPYVFERFSQADSGMTRRRGGLGLGLSIALHLVEMHGGTIEASSEGRGRGARFTVRLPLLMTAQDARYRSLDARAIRSAGGDSRTALDEQ